MEEEKGQVTRAKLLLKQHFRERVLVFFVQVTTHVPIIQHTLTRLCKKYLLHLSQVFS